MDKKKQDVTIANAIRYGMLCNNNEPRNSGMMAEVAAVAAYNVSNQDSLASLPIYTSRFQCKTLFGALPGQDKYKMDVFITDANENMQAFVQVKDFVNAKMDVNMVAHNAVGPFRCLLDNDISLTDICRARAMLGREFIIMVADDTNQPPSAGIALLQSMFDQLLGAIGMHVRVIVYNWNDTMQLLDTQRECTMQIIQNTALSNLISTNTKTGELRSHVTSTSESIMISRNGTKCRFPIGVDKITWSLVEEVAILLNLSIGIGKTQIGWKLLKIAMQLFPGYKHLFVAGSKNIAQYLEEAIKTGIDVEYVYVVKSRLDKIPKNKQLIITTPGLVNFEMYSDMQLGVVIVDEAHRFSTTGYTRDYSKSIDKSDLTRYHLLKILQHNNVKDIVLMTGTPTMKNNSDASRILNISLARSAEADIVHMPEICVMYLPDDIDHRHAEIANHVIANKYYFMQMCCFIRFNFVKHAERVYRWLTKHGVLCYPYFGNYIANGHRDLPTIDTRGLIICVNACDGNVNLPISECILFADQINPLCVDFIQAIGRVVRKAPGKKGAHIIIPQFASQTPSDFVLPAISCFAIRGGMNIYSLKTTYVYHDQLQRHDVQKFLTYGAVDKINKKRKHVGEQATLIDDFVLDNEHIAPISNKMSIEKCLQMINDTLYVPRVSMNDKCLSKQQELVQWVNNNGKTPIRVSHCEIEQMLGNLWQQVKSQKSHVSFYNSLLADDSIICHVLTNDLKRYIRKKTNDAGEIGSLSLQDIFAYDDVQNILPNSIGDISGTNLYKYLSGLCSPSNTDPNMLNDRQFVKSIIDKYDAKSTNDNDEGAQTNKKYEFAKYILERYNKNLQKSNMKKVGAAELKKTYETFIKLIPETVRSSDVYKNTGNLRNINKIQAFIGYLIDKNGILPTQRSKPFGSFSENLKHHANNNKSTRVYMHSLPLNASVLAKLAVNWHDPRFGLVKTE